VHHCIETGYPAWGNLAETVKHSEDNNTNGWIMHAGQPIFEWLKEHPAEQEDFLQGMSNVDALGTFPPSLSPSTLPSLASSCALDAGLRVQMWGSSMWANYSTCRTAWLPARHVKCQCSRCGTPSPAPAPSLPPSFPPISPAPVPPSVPPSFCSQCSRTSCKACPMWMLLVRLPLFRPLKFLCVELSCVDYKGKLTQLTKR
jgi:hypothetical protein